MNSVSPPRILVIAAWFGPLPDYFPLWIMSCRYNPDIDWLLVTDATIPDIPLPNNVHPRAMSMTGFAKRIECAVGFPVAFEKPYKACDYKPVYGCLTDLVPGSWDFWGHCDLDMLFGNIRTFLTPDLLASHDRLFGLGHFSLYRNDTLTNTFYRRPCPGLDYRKILSDSVHRGFDEHIGVNRIWHHHNGRFHEDESILADIDPHIRTFHRTASYIRVNNNRWQVFAFNRGRILRYFWRWGKVHSEEFMYIHFQKRRFTLPTPPPGTNRIWLTPRGFVPMKEDDIPPDRARITELNPRPLLPSLNEFSYRIRHILRLLHRRLKRNKS